MRRRPYFSDSVTETRGWMVNLYIVFFKWLFPWAWAQVILSLALILILVQWLGAIAIHSWDRRRRGR